MAMIKINNSDKVVLGSVNFTRDAVYDERSGRVIGSTITGMLATREYIEELHRIESERFILNGVDVFREGFGSNEYYILYHFNAKELTVKEDYLDDDIKWLIEEKIIKEEKEGNEFFHGYLMNEALEEANKLAEEYERKEAEVDE